MANQFEETNESNNESNAEEVNADEVQNRDDVTVNALLERILQST